MSFANIIDEFHPSLGMSMTERPIRYRFYATFNAPGFHEIESFLAETLEEAMEQAMEERSICWKGWPLNKEGIRVEVDPRWDAVKLPDGRFLLRREYEREKLCVAE